MPPRSRLTACGETSRGCHVSWFTSNPSANSTTGVPSGSPSVPVQREIRWNAEITEDTPNQRIAWRSLPNSDVQTSGSVDFRPDPQGRGTFVSANVQYGLPGGPLTSGLAALFGKNPEFVVREDVRRFKQLLETGEVPTTRGQTHGPRGIHGHTEQVLFREKTNLPDPQVAPAYSRSA